ncbi:MAG: OmpH family outer membrane protein [Moraxellaceae bacterium]|nr:OmpH family outer membrane protein [Moraxellaceae bacterium]MBP8851731.1 OmpH family outer membrane protein [Moraxellaceae bacterium]MBP9045038.1 OmpH family outer membrane protein [Moraxellaceae bacterium]MBP9730069.1 OmpH family outer membrane protein [Moraxellaceae bacterium]
MRHALMVVGIVAGLVSGSAMAAANVVVADSQAALMATDVARKAVEKLQVEMKLQRERMEAIRKEVKVIEDRFQKDSTVLSETDKKNMQKQAESKLSEYRNLGEAVQKRTQEVQAELLQRMVPKMEAVIDELRKANGYDIIVEKKNVIFADTTVDITRKITEKLNAAK